MPSFRDENTAFLQDDASGRIVVEIANKMVDNRAYLSEIDGKTGDGDHGVNMAKGFGMAADRLRGQDCSLGEAFDILGNILLSEIGGSMGPLYGFMFTEFGKEIVSKPNVRSDDFSLMLKAGLAGIESVGSAKVGDKTLLDTLVPAITAFDTAIAEGKSFSQSLEELAAAAGSGRDSTKDMVAKIGRASRLGERSRGFLDAGATSCAIILQTLSAGMQSRLPPIHP